LPPRFVNKKVFEDELPFAAVQRAATVNALNLAIGPRFGLDANKPVL
jgi:hypothetical protein